MPDELMGLSLTQAEHVSVLLAESVSALSVRADGSYLDGTFGRGGHSREILSLLSPSGQLMAVDKDPAAEASAKALADDSRFKFVAAVLLTSQTLSVMGRLMASCWISVFLTAA